MICALMREATSPQPVGGSSAIIGTLVRGTDMAPD